MALENVFEADIFSQVELTASLNKMPYKPARLGQMGLFTEKPIRTTSAVVEEQSGKLVLINTKARGASGDVYSKERRSARSFLVPHLPLNAQVLADDVQGVRAMGSEDQLLEFSSEVNDKLEAMRQSHEYTHEWHRVGAISGIVLDGDLTTEIVNWFDEFGITEKVITIDLSAETGDEVKEKAREVRHHIEDALGGTPFSSIHAMCSREFFTDLILKPEIKAAYERWNSGQFLREDQQAFSYGGIMWEEYRGKVGTTSFIDSDTCRFFPVGAPDVFNVAVAPANFIETVNQRGQLIYAKQERMKFDMGMEIHTQSNVLHFCNRPACLVKGTNTAGSGSE